ncbi:MAG: hypothetical protein K9H48_07865 [Melioribacteraceae bacterium]|nr:hypothetical protein [Melioribacteraceae bacterium]
MELNDLFDYPAILRTKENINKLKALQTNLIDLNIQENSIILIGRTSKYIQKFQLFSEEIKINSEIKFNCSCEDFLYRYAHILNDADLLFQPEEFEKAIKNSPTKTNKLSVLFGCKHCVSFARYLKNHQTKVNNFIQGRRNSND